ncbi:MAG: ATP-binding protein [Candidatus Gorgyraea atricola]|nr:ATP-binding protein [Candidatus Gorgyraea atricola]
MITIYTIQPLIISIIYLFIGFFAFSKNTRSLINRTFLFECISVSVWLLGYFVVYSRSKPEDAIFWCKFAYVGVIFIPVCFYHFTIAFLGIIKKKFTILVYLVGFIFVILTITTDQIVSGFYEFYWGYQTKVGFLHNIFLLGYGFLYLYCLGMLYSGFKKNKFIASIEYNKIKYIFIAYIIASIGSIDFLPNYGFEFYPFGSIFVLAGLATISYAIVRFRIMNVNIALTRAGIFAFVYAVVLGIPFGLGGLVKEPLSRATSSWWLLPVFLMALLASLGPFIYMKLQKRIESRLRAEEFKSQEALRRLSHNMLRFANLNNLLKLIVHQLVKILKLKFAAIYLFDAKRDKYILKNYWRPMQPLDSTFEPTREFSKDSALIKDLYMRRLPIVTEEIRLFAPKGVSPHVKELINSLSHLKANSVIPSFLRNDLIGFVILSNKRTNAAFTQEDLNLLMVLSNEVGLAVENAQFHQKEKMVLVEKSRREALADMAPGASHQFNNRLVAISSSAELLLMKLEGLKMDQVNDEKVKAVLKDAKSTLELIDKEVYKGKEITSAILKRAKAKVDFQKVNVRNLIENAYRLVLISHSRSGIGGFKEPKFKLKFLNDIPVIFGSEALLQDCFYNLIDNAFDAICDALKEKAGVMTQGEVIVNLKREGNILAVQVKDNGTGLTKESQKKLFTPYFTTKATSNKGSGLGLYVIRDFIEMHGGSIRCESEYGKGATFIIKLPIEKRKKKRGE